ncbi:alanine racemase [Suttonella ornithocola]|uniref:Alanine racemase n=1 Tax=Suttonella ornithocola TaxID=279832 RepID=A0A380MQS6_9GAMM|nr:alanine racemase [Suttonella ornithocola]SUO94416.1 Alanine racemase, biosynthetic [Suttonella ornithocola]
MRPLKKVINLAALKHNWSSLAAASGTAEMVAVVKANAYGHDVKTVATALMPKMYAVASIEEALALRELGVKTPVMLLEGVFTADELSVCAAQGFQPVIHNAEQLSWLKTLIMPLKAWVKIDSGMHRLGFPAEQSSISQTSALPHIEWQGIVSHFACADEPDLTYAQQQLAALNALSLPPHWQRSFANSAAIFSLPDARAEWTRPGVLLYGLSPFPNQTAADLGLQAVMTLETQILAIRYIKRGENAGYGQGFQAKEDGYLATIALGYGDGFNRSIESGKVHVRIGENVYPLVGRIAMDMSLVWLGKHVFSVGERVVIFGEEYPAEKLAQQANTIPYTLTTMLTPRVRLEVING